MSSYDKILPTKNYYSDTTTPYWIPYSGGIGNASLSTLTVSTINGVQVPNLVQLQTTNPNSRTGLAIPTSTWTPLLSTVNNFNFLAGKAYNVQFPFGGDITAAPADAAANISFGVGKQTQGTPNTVYTVKTAAGETQTLVNGSLNSILTSPTTSSEPLVAYMYVQGAASNATMAVLGGGSAINPYVVQQLN